MQCLYLNSGNAVRFDLLAKPSFINVSRRLDHNLPRISPRVRNIKIRSNHVASGTLSLGNQGATYCAMGRRNVIGPPNDFAAREGNGSISGRDAQQC